jgi:hypothetical protein
VADRDIRFKISAEDATRAGFRSVESGLSRIKAEAAGLATSFGLLGGLSLAATGAALGKGLSSAITELADLDDAAQKSGASVESLSSLLNTLAPTGVGIAQITDLASKLTRAMVGADEETSKAAEAFRLLGVSTKDGAGNLRSVDDVLVEVSQALAGYQDGTNKAAIAQALLGKSGTEYLPVLKDLAEFQREAASVTAEQAQKAADLQDAWGKLGVEATKLKQSIASEIIPELLKLITQFNAAGAAGASFYERIRASIGPVKFVAELEGDLAALQKRRDALANDTRPLMQRGKADGLKELDKDIAAIQARIERIRPALRVAEGPSLAELLGASGVDAKPGAPRLAGSDDKGRKAADDAAEAYRKLDEIIRQADLDDTLKQQAKAQDAVNKATAEYLGLLGRLAGNEREGAEAALSPDVQGWQKVADLLREIRGIDTNTKARDASLNVANELLNAGAITFDEYEQLGSKILELKDPIAEVAAASKDIFAPIESAFEAALFDAEKLSDVVRGLAVDIAKIALRQQITGPLASFLGGGFDAGRDGGTIFGQLLSGITGSGGGPELLNAPIEMSAPRAATKSAGSVMVNQTISYGGGGGRAEAFAFAQTVKSDTIRAIRESEARGA